VRGTDGALQTGSLSARDLPVHFPGVNLLLRTTLWLGAVVLVAAPAARTQTEQPGPRAHDGFWVGFSAGTGSARTFCDACTSNPWIRSSVSSLKLGGTPNQNLRIGAAIDAWGRSAGGYSEIEGNFTFSLYYYPSTTKGLYLTGGLGAAQYIYRTSPQVYGIGVGLTGGAGYDVPLGRHIFLTPCVVYTWGNVGNVEDQQTYETVAANWKQEFVSLEVGVSYH